MSSRVLLGLIAAVSVLFAGLSAAPPARAAQCWTNPDGSQDCVSANCAGGEVNGRPVPCRPALDPLLPPAPPVAIGIGIGGLP